MQVNHLNTELGIELVAIKMSFHDDDNDDDNDGADCYHKTQQGSAAQDSLLIRQTFMLAIRVCLRFGLSFTQTHLFKLLCNSH